jgi:hypothetical protein
LHPEPQILNPIRQTFSPSPLRLNIEPSYLHRKPQLISNNSNSQIRNAQPSTLNPELYVSIGVAEVHTERGRVATAMLGLSFSGEP